MAEEAEIITTISVPDQTITIFARVKGVDETLAAIFELRDARVREALKIIGWTLPERELTFDECKERLLEVYPMVKSES